MRKRICKLVVLALLMSVFAAGGAWAEAAGGGQAEGEAALREIYRQLNDGQRLVEEKEYEVPEAPTVYLTFDDGPSEHTERVLDILSEEGVPGTFFVLGEQAERHPELIRRMVREGHALGNHTYDHVYEKLYGGFGTFWEQVERTEKTLASIAGVGTRLLRAPGGTFANFDPYYFYYLRQAGYAVHDWNVDSGDSRRKGVPASEILRTVRDSKRHHETVVLMHDGIGHGETVKALPEIIRYYRGLGYAFTVLTPRVKPAVFSAAKPKWSRSPPTWEQFAGQLAAIGRLLGETMDREERLADAERPASREPAAVTEAVYAAESGVRPELKLQVNGRDVVLGPEQYWLEADRLQVPLRRLAESMGGIVSWDGERRIASVVYGPVRLEYRIADKLLAVYHFGQEATRVHLPQMELQDGSLIVPLRATVNQLGEKLRDVHWDPENPFVAVAGKLSFYYV